MSISYAPGTAFALVRPGVVVLLDDAVEPAAVTAIWAALEGLGRPDGMADVLDSLTTVLDPTLRDLPDFGVVVHESAADGSETGVLHVVARGRISVHLAGEVGSETIEAFDMTTWADKRFTDVDTYELAAGKTGVTGDLALALSTGVVTARSVTWVRQHEPDAGAEGAGASGLVDEAAASGADSESESAAVDGEPAPSAAGEEPVPTAEGAGLPAPGDDDGAAPDPAMVPVDPAEPDFARTLGEFPDGTAADGTVSDEQAPDEQQPGEEASDEQASGEPTPDDDLEDTVFSLEGVRGLLAADRGAPARSALEGSEAPEALEPSERPVPPADDGAAQSSLPPVPPPPPEQAYPAPAPLPSSAPQPAYAPLPSVAPLPSGAPADGYAPYPVYQAAPQMPPGEAFVTAAGQPAGDAPEGDPEPPRQWSVQLPGSPAPLVETVAPAVVSDAPTILARSCAYGHANTPVRSTCAVCGGGLNPQAEVVPRPSLGRVLLSTGDVVELEQPVVFGRYPQAHVVTAQVQAPRLVTVPSPSQDISRSHVEVRLEGWNVLLVDLTTVNGTTLLRPGQPPRRLHPQEPTLVMSGDVADLGDGVRLTFEGLA